MAKRSYPSGTEVRKALVERAALYSELTNTGISSIGREAVNDSNFLREVGAGRNFTIGSYDSVMRWLDKHWPQERAVR
jgi:hypothetical protein